MPSFAGQFDDDARRDAETLVELAFAEDYGTPRPRIAADPKAGRIELELTETGRQPGDLTSMACIPDRARGSARFVARADGVVAGLPVVKLAAARFGLASGFRHLIEDGQRVAPGVAVAEVFGPIGQILGFERTALNFLQRLSGVATLTDRFVRAVAGTNAVILDTRKTTPGWRALERYAVRCGGGTNHRNGLYDAVLIKDNHLACLASLGEVDPVGSAVAASRAKSPAGTVVEVEIDNLEQLDRALEARPDIVLVDNFPIESLVEAVRRRDSRAPGILLEASGGVSLDTVADRARTGVDRISVGALTHSAPALDVGLDYDEAPSDP